MKLKTEETIIISYDKKGNVKKVKTPYKKTEPYKSFKKIRKEKRLNALYSDEVSKQLDNMFKGFGEAFNYSFQK